MVIAIFLTGIALADPPATDDEAEAIKRLIRKRMQEGEQTPKEKPTQLRLPPKRADHATRREGLGWLWFIRAIREARSRAAAGPINPNRSFL